MLNRMNSVRVNADLFSRWYAARQLFQEGRSVYDPTNGQEAAQYKTRPTLPLEAGFYYPVYLALVLWPLTLLPYPTAHLLWTISIGLIYFSAIFVVTGLMHWPASLNRLTALVLLSTFFIPYLQCTIWSQFDALALFSVAFCFLAIRKERYFLAGILAGGFLFKPQVALLTVAFLLIWSLISAKRRFFIVGFGLTSLLLWAGAQLVQPGWVPEFIKALQAYQGLPYKIGSVLDGLWNPGHLLSVLLLAASVWLFIVFRTAPADSPAFGLCMAISLCAWWLVVPIIGMTQLIPLPVAAVFSLAGLQKVKGSAFRVTVIASLLLFALSWAGFVVGLSIPGMYGVHIEIAEFALKILAPMVLMAASFYGLLIMRKLKGLYA